MDPLVPDWRRRLTSSGDGDVERGTRVKIDAEDGERGEATGRSQMSACFDVDRAVDRAPAGERAIGHYYEGRRTGGDRALHLQRAALDFVAAGEGIVPAERERSRTVFHETVERWIGTNDVVAH